MQISKTLSDLSVRAKLSLMVVVFMGANFATGVVLWNALHKARIGSELHGQMSEAADLIADVLPPPLYGIEAYLVAYMANGETDRAKLIDQQSHFRKLQDDYNDRYKHWEKVLQPGSLRDELLDHSTKEAEQFFRIGNAQFFPAKLAGEEAKATALLKGPMFQSYTAHREAVDRVVNLANEYQARTKDGALALVAHGENMALTLGLVFLGLSLMFSFWVGTRITRPLTAAVSDLRALASGDLTRRITVLSRDEIGQVAEATNEAIEGLYLARAEASRFVAGANKVLARVAKRDLTARLEGEFSEAYAQLQEALNNTVGNLHNAMTQVGSAAEQVAAASTEITSASQSLAQSTSRGAATIEEVTSSLQELASMAAQNASHAQQASSLGQGTRTAAERGADSMLRLTKSIETIKSSADETAKIVKTIDDIAFQTNLLALNAAVEAARAGDAGRGFAVVADEVRSLAMRSAEAARMTSELIQGSIKRTEEGVVLNRETMDHLGDITKQVRRMVEVINEIAAASEQQNTGVGQINRAMDEMSRMTQQNAATSEETASASEQLAGQSRGLIEIVAELAGTELTRGNESSRGAGRGARPEAPGRKMLASSMSLKGGASNGRSSTNGVGHASGGSLSQARKAFPLDEDADVLTKF